MGRVPSCGDRLSESRRHPCLLPRRARDVRGGGASGRRRDSRAPLFRAAGSGGGHLGTARLRARGGGAAAVSRRPRRPSPGALSPGSAAARRVRAAPCRDRCGRFSPASSSSSSSPPSSTSSSTTSASGPTGTRWRSSCSRCRSAGWGGEAVRDAGGPARRVSVGRLLVAFESRTPAYSMEAPDAIRGIAAPRDGQGRTGTCGPHSSS